MATPGDTKSWAIEAQDAWCPALLRFQPFCQYNLAFIHRWRRWGRWMIRKEMESWSTSALWPATRASHSLRYLSPSSNYDLFFLLWIHFLQHGNGVWLFEPHEQGDERGTRWSRRQIGRGACYEQGDEHDTRWSRRQIGRGAFGPTFHCYKTDQKSKYRRNGPFFISR